MARARLALSLSILALAGLPACENTADKQRQADQAQAAADQKKAAAEEEAQHKAAEAYNAAQQVATNAQRKADDKETAVLTKLSKEQVDSMSKVSSAIQDLNGKLDELNAASKAETEANKQAEDTRLTTDLSARIAILQADEKAIVESTAMSWPTVEAKVDKDLDGYRSSARTASVRIKSAPR
jgi:hypothetical protein